MVCASEQRGIDAGKKVKGTKRHIVADTLGNLIHVIVHAANTHVTIHYRTLFRITNATLYIQTESTNYMS